ncbi:bifunctional endoribonuclease/protein kinase ire1 [Savitreella phatthalungensis]
MPAVTAQSSVSGFPDTAEALVASSRRAFSSMTQDAAGMELEVRTGLPPRAQPSGKAEQRKDVLPHSRAGNPAAAKDWTVHGRDIKDWLLSDLSIVATLDGSLHALDRISGDVRWSISSAQATLRTRRHPAANTSDYAIEQDRDTWIVEPIDDGGLYVFNREEGLHKLPFGIRQLVENSPFTVPGDNKVYVGERRTTLFSIDPKSGNILEAYGTDFGHSGTVSVPDGTQSPSCPAKRDALDDLDDDLRSECQAADPNSQTVLRMGRNTYTLTIFLGGETLWNVTYAEWVPNTVDTDLRRQYSETFDGRYISPMHDGRLIAHDAETKEPIWFQSFTSAVLRVYDVLHQYDRGSRGGRRGNGLSGSPPRTVPREEDLAAVAVVAQPIDPQIRFTPKRDANGNLPDGVKDGATFIGVSECGDLYAMSVEKCPLIIAGPRTHWSQGDHVGAPEDLKGVHMHNRVEIRPGLSPGHPLTIDGSSENNERANPASPDDVKRIDDKTNANSRPSIDGPKQPRQQPPTKAIKLLKLYALLATVIAVYVTWRQYGQALSLKGLHKKHVGPVPEIVVTEPQELTKASVPQVRFAGIDVAEDEATASREAQVDSTTATASPDTSPQAAEGGSSESVTDQAADQEPKKSKRKRGSRGGKKTRENKLHAISASSSSQQTTSHDNDSSSDTEASPEDKPEVIKSLKVEPLVPAQGKFDGPLQLNNLKVTDQILGYGSHGTVVFRGTFGKRDVAVKRMLLDFYDIASHEVELLEQSDDHPNVVRYYCKQENERFLYIALELCEASLAETTERPRDYPDLEPYLHDPVSILRQMALGVQSLHSLKIVHRDLKPQNILVNPPLKAINGTVLGENRCARVVISDFGLCKRLDADQSSFRATTAQAAGTSGWRAPELLVDETAALAAAQSTATTPQDHSPTTTNGESSQSQSQQPAGAPRKVSRAIDIFSLGCLFYYVLSAGQHPFGDRYMREANIIRSQPCLDALELHGETGVLAKELITRMIARDPKSRPDAAEILRHPLFWSADRRLSFLLDMSDRLDVEERDPPSPLLLLVEGPAREIVHGNWVARLDRHLVDNLGKYRSYKTHSILDLLRALRNKKHHYQDLPDNVQHALGPIPAGFLAYFESRFPKLLLHCWQIAKEELAHEPLIKLYFE